MHRIAVAACLAAVCLGASYVAPQDLVAHWSFDEGSGEVAKDLTGHGHDAALKNIEWVRSPRGYALRFDSKDDLAQYGDVESMNLAGDITLAVWLRTDSSVEPKTNRIIFGDTGLGVERNMNLRMDGYGYLRFEWADGERNASLLASNSLLNGTWKHVVVVGDSRAKLATMYVDGRQVAQMTMPLPISKAPTKERLTGWFYNGYFQGDLDDIRLYSRALAPAEVTQLYQSGADLEIGRARVVFDASGPEARAVVSVPVHNYSKQSCGIEVPPVLGRPAQRLQMKPGADIEIMVGQLALQPVWRGRSDLLLCEAPPDEQAVTFTTHVGDLTEAQPVDTAAQLVIEPLQVYVTDPWQKDMKPGKTARLVVDIDVNMPAAQLREGALRLALTSRETGETALTREVESSRNHTELALDVRSLPWGAYDMAVSFAKADGKEVVSTTRRATILPGGKEQVRVLNNLVSELMDARSRGLLGSEQIAFMNPRDGWVWFRAAGDCAVRLPSPSTPMPPNTSREEGPNTGLLPSAGGVSGPDSLTPRAGQPPVEAMRLLPAGKHVLTVSGNPTDLVVRAIPGLLYNVYPSQSQIAPFGPNDWQRLSGYTLPNINMIEGQVIDTPEYREFVAQGKLWIANMQAPGLIDKQEWTPEKMLQAWRQPRGWDLAKIAGIQSDEYSPGLAREMIMTTALSVARLAEDPDFSGRLWIPFVVRMYGNELAELFMKITIGAGWPFSIEVYQGEARTEAENREAITARFRECAEGWERAYPGSLRRAIFTPMYAYLPYCTTNCYPQADFRVHLDMQMQVLANDPAFFGLWGVQPYRSNYVDPEILDTMGMMLRHYCIEGKTGPMLTDPYELKHVTDPDFEQGTEQWQLAPAEAGAIAAGEFPGYGRLQGRYPGGAFGDTFLLMKRSARAPNRFSQEMRGLQAGRLYSLKLITGDYADLQAGTSRKDQQAVAIQVEGAQVQEGAFSYPFCSARGPAPFTTDNRFWMTYHWLQFRAQGPTAMLTVSDWATPDAPGGPVGQEVMYSFVEVQPVLERP
jgi:hypothetical protein